MSVSQVPWAVCKIDREPLISTIAVRKKEWVCVTCGNFYTFFGADSSTDDLEARYTEVKKIWDTKKDEILAAHYAKWTVQ